MRQLHYRISHSVLIGQFVSANWLAGWLSHLVGQPVDPKLTVSIAEKLNKTSSVERR
jgi:hypothetical protein